MQYIGLYCSSLHSTLLLYSALYSNQIPNKVLSVVVINIFVLIHLSSSLACLPKSFDLALIMVPSTQFQNINTLSKFPFYTSWYLLNASSIWAFCSIMWLFNVGIQAAGRKFMVSIYWYVLILNFSMYSLKAHCTI